MDKPDLTPDTRATALVASIIGLAHSLGLRIVAEGVENQVAYTELARMGCDQAQGYFMCRPVPIAELQHWLNRRHAVQPSTDTPSHEATQPSDHVLSSQMRTVLVPKSE